MGIIDQLLASSSGQTVGPDGLLYSLDYSGNTTQDAQGRIIPTRFSVTDPNGSQEAGTTYPIFNGGGQQVSTGRYDTGDINFNDVLTGVEYVGAGALGFNAAFAGLGAAGAGEGGSMTGDFSLGDGMTASDFSYGADPLTADSLMSSLGASLNGGTGFSKLLPLISQLVGGNAARRSGNTAADLAQQLINRSDPFAPYRAGYGQKLQDLEASHDVTSIPGYQAGLDAVQRAGAAQGFTGSGNMMKALQDYGGNFYNAELQRLAGLAGAGATPGAGFGTAAGLIGQGQASSAFGNQQILNALSGILGPGNPLSSVMSGLGSPGLAGDPLDVPVDISTTDLFTP